MSKSRFCQRCDPLSIQYETRTTKKNIANGYVLNSIDFSLDCVLIFHLQIMSHAFVIGLFLLKNKCFVHKIKYNVNIGLEMPLGMKYR